MNMTKRPKFGKEEWTVTGGLVFAIVCFFFAGWWFPALLDAFVIGVVYGTSLE